MKFNKILVTALFLSFSFTQAQQVAKGYVYEDANNNGKKIDVKKVLQTFLLVMG